MKTLSEIATKLGISYQATRLRAIRLGYIQPGEWHRNAEYTEEQIKQIANYQAMPRNRPTKGEDIDIEPKIDE
jgi:Zn-dependent peptidase ImmA (M78 family)